MCYSPDGVVVVVVVDACQLVSASGVQRNGGDAA